MNLQGKKILVGISASIAAYKIPDFVRQLIKQGAEVKVIMTPASKDFVSPLVLATLSKNQVLTELFDENTWSNHVMLGRWADLFVVAPLSCNTLAKMSKGICDNFLLAVYLSATCPIMVAPAMDEDMWKHPATKQNLDTLRQYGHMVLDSEYGELASGLVGQGRMVEPETIVEKIYSYFKSKQALSNKSALVTAGPTYENIDPVRFIGNYSSGKMGVAIAYALAEQGCKVKLVLGPSSLQVQHPMIEVINVRSAQQMFDAALADFDKMDIAVMSAAVADYTPIEVQSKKIKKKEDTFQIELGKTKDILKHLGSIKQKHQVLLGFALENDNEQAYAQKKLQEKNADMIVLNSLNDKGAGFAGDNNKVSIFEKNGSITTYDLKPKAQVARDIVSKIIAYVHALNP